MYCLKKKKKTQSLENVTASAMTSSASTTYSL